MAQYDGSIRINTKIDTKSASAQLMAFEKRIAETADGIASLRPKMDSLKNAKIPTEEYKALQSDLQVAKNFLSELIAKQKQWEELGISSGHKWDSLNERIEVARGRVDLIKEKMQALVDSGKAFTLGKDTAQYASLDSELQRAEGDLDALKQRHVDLALEQKKNIGGYKQLGKIARDSARTANKSIKGVNGTLIGGLKNILKYSLGISSIYALFNKLRTGVKEGFSNLYKDTGITSFKDQVDGLKASLLTLKNSFAAAFRPLVEVAIPYIQRATDALSNFLDQIGQFNAAIRGQKTYTKAIRQTTAAIQDEEKAQNKQLSSLDKLNNLSSDNTGGSESGAQMFEENVPVDSYFEDLASSADDIFSKFFAPLKAAWESDGEVVIGSWRNSLQEMWSLMQDIGSDFLTVWNEGSTIQLFSNILKTVRDIGLVVGNLATSLSDAWNTNKIGLSILGNIRDIFLSIVRHIKSAADYTVTWSEGIDFYPLLESINGLLESLSPFTDTIGSGLEWFWNNVLLPIAGWTIQDAVPAFLNMLSAAIGVLNATINALKPVGVWLWDNFLAPLGQWTGDLLISAMETITDLFKFLTDVLTESGDSTSLFSEIVDTLSSAWSGLIEILTPLADFIQTTLMSVWNDMISPALEYLGKTVLPVLIETFENLWNNVLVPLGNFIGSILGPVFEMLADVLSTLWENVVVPLAQFVGEILGKAFEGLSEILNKVIIPVVNALIKVLQFLWNNVLSPLVSHLKDVLGPVFSSVFGTIKTVIQNLKKIFGGLIDFITGIFTRNWKKAWGGITSIFEGILGVIKGVVNGVLGVIEALANGVIKGINTVIGALNKVKFDIPDWVPALGGKTFGFNIPNLNTISIPKLATGTVIPPNREFLAVLGDQKHGTNIEAPLDTIKQANKEAFLEVLSKFGFSAGSSRSSGNETFVFQVDGRTFFEITRKEAQEYFDRTGMSAFPF